MCARPRKMAAHFTGAPRINFTSSAEMNSACGKVLPLAKHLYAPFGATGAHIHRRSFPMANGIIIIDKPGGWTSMDVCPSP